MMDAVKFPTGHANGGQETLPPSSAACVDLLERTLADAKIGKITSLCIVAVGPNGLGPAFVGAQVPEINLGLDAAKAFILQSTMPQQQSRQSPIIRPGFRPGR